MATPAGRSLFLDFFGVKRVHGSSYALYAAPTPCRGPWQPRESLDEKKHERPLVPTSTYVRAELVSPRITTLAADWQVWDSAQEGTVGTIHIDYDGDYGSERVLIVSGRATVTPTDRVCDGSPSFNVSPGDAVYFMAGFRCTWHIHEAPLVQRYGFFGFDGKEIKDAEVICDAVWLRLERRRVVSLR